MDAQSSTDAQVFRAGVHLYVIIGVFGVLFSAVALYIGMHKGIWTILPVVVGLFAVQFLLLQVLRLEIGAAGFKYRNLGGSREVEFTEVRRAGLVILGGNKRTVVFGIERQDGRLVKVNLRTFSVKAAAVLFTALESRGIRIEVPFVWAAWQMDEQVRAAQARMRE